MQNTTFKPVYIVDGARTPFLKARGIRGPFSASDLATKASQSLLTKHHVAPETLDEVIMGCMIPSENEANIGRIIALRIGCGHRVPGWTVQRNCASGMQSLDAAYQNIATGRSQLVLAGGTETMSRAPLLYQPETVNWLARFGKAKTVMAKLALLKELRPSYLKPIISLLHGLTDFLCNCNMGQSSEEVAYRYGITRHDMDSFAMQSQLRAAQAQSEGHFSEELSAVFDASGRLYDHDDGVRADTTLDTLAKLRPAFDRKFGAITPANSSQVSDGAAVLLMASEEAVERYQLPVLGRYVDTHWAGCNPQLMGLGPSYAVPPLMKKHNLSVSDIDYWEINEAFAAQALGCLKAWESEEFCRQELGLDQAFGSIDQARLNIDGGAIALGHPVGASGARIVLHTLKVLERTQQQRGIASLCIGGGIGGAALLERVN